jgi:hypothetical protein
LAGIVELWPVHGPQRQGHGEILDGCVAEFDDVCKIVSEICGSVSVSLQVSLGSLLAS